MGFRETSTVPPPPRSFNSSTRKSCFGNPNRKVACLPSIHFFRGFCCWTSGGFLWPLEYSISAIHFDQSPLRKEVLHIPDSQYCEREATPAIWRQWNHVLTSFPKIVWLQVADAASETPKRKTLKKHIVKGPLTNQNALLEKMVPCTNTAQMLQL